MANVNFAAPADPYRGRRCSAESSIGSWVRQYASKFARKPWPKITYPRPLSERASFLHTEWDKWPAGIAWSPRIGVKDAVFPYKVFLSGNYPSGTTWAWYLEDENGVTTPYLRLYNAGMTAGTYSFTITVRDQFLYSATVAVSLTVWAANDANILNQFRIIDGTAGGGGTGTPALPYNNWNSMYGATYSDSTVMVIITGNLAVTSATGLALGGTKPKQIIAVPAATVSFDLTSIADKFTITSSDGSDLMLKNFSITGQAAAGANQSQVGQANTRDRTSLHDIDFYDLLSSSANNQGSFGGDGNARKNYTTILGCSGTNIGAGGTGCEIITFEQVDLLIDDYVSNNPNEANPSFAALHLKHDNKDWEVRRFTALEAEGYDYSPLHFGASGSSADLLKQGSGIVRHCNLAPSTNAGATACIRLGCDADDSAYVAFIRNTLIGGVIDRPTWATAATVQTFYDGNIFQNSDTNGVGTTTNEVPFTGEAAIPGDNLNSSSCLVDASGNPLNAAHIGRYGHRLS